VELRALASAASIASASNRELLIVWEPDHHCRARFEDLFEIVAPDAPQRTVPVHVVETVRDLEALVAAETGTPDVDAAALHLLGWDCYDYMDFAQTYRRIDERSANDIYTVSAFSLVSDVTGWDHDSRWLRANCAFDLTGAADQLVRPHPVARSRVEAWLSGFDRLAGETNAIARTIAIHVRTGETGLTADARPTPPTVAWRRASRPETFLDEMRRIRAEHPGQRFYVTADHPAVYEAIVHEFGPANTADSAVVHLDRRHFDRSTAGTVEALVEMLICARCANLLGSNWSAFTELIVRLSGRPSRVAGRDFGGVAGPKRPATAAP
jgi:hypothetical protein